MPKLPKVVSTGDTARRDARRGMKAFAERAGAMCRIVEEQTAALSPPVLRDARLVVVFGGDGAILMTARHLGGSDVPVVGVNMGKLGFLAPYTVDQLVEHLPDILAGEIAPSPRMMLDCTIERRGRTVFESLALNEVAISGGLPSRLHWIDVQVNGGEECVAYRGDGMIIATPVGSTGYNLAAGGPLMAPTMEAIVVRPVCPHTFASRSLVVPADTHLTLTTRPPIRGVGMTIDGQDWMRMTRDDRIHVRRADHPLWFVPRPGQTYFQTLREKFYWGGHPNYGDENSEG